ncbi:MAG TPA: hypothetical protein PK762_04725 [Candidatus Kapabacteria bacterium]|nr:hypothetical protein [Candidatus Kapabacteria bacterium]
MKPKKLFILLIPLIALLFCSCSNKLSIVTRSTFCYLEPGQKIEHNKFENDFIDVEFEERYVFNVTDTDNTTYKVSVFPVYLEPGVGEFGAIIFKDSLVLHWGFIDELLKHDNPLIQRIGEKVAQEIIKKEGYDK